MLSVSYISLTLLLVLSVMASPSQKLNLRPIIGVLSEPPKDGPGIVPTNSMFPADYVRWLSAAGARFDMPHDQLRALFHSINGILFTGGSLTLTPDTQYYKTVEFLYHLAIEANEKGDYFPLWGTCQGFQLLTLLIARDPNVYLRNHFDSWNYSIPLQLTPLATSSRLFSGLLPETVKTFTTRNCTQNLHKDGVSPSSYKDNENLAREVRLLSVNVDRKGVPFASTLEGTKHPIYATQWHPERNQFDWGINEGLDKSVEALKAMQDLANFFVTETRKNFHSFPSVEEERAALIFNYSPTYTGDQGLFPEEETYIFPLEGEQ